MDFPYPTHFGSDGETSHTGRLLEELQLFGFRPFEDGPDPRPLPEADVIESAVATLFDALTTSLSDTRLEPDLDKLLWSMVNIFHRTSQRIERELDDNETAQRRLQKEQDGTELKSVELENLVLQGQTLIERRDAFELMRDLATGHYASATGDVWRPQSGSQVSHRHLTAAALDSRDFLKARRAAYDEVHNPQGTLIAVSGGADFNDYTLIWDTLDRARQKHSDMVLLHGGTKRGAEFIARRWAETRGVTHIAFEPNWGLHGRGAPFKRNIAMLDTLPTGIIVFPGNGIQDNLFDKARGLGLKVWRVGTA